MENLKRYIVAIDEGTTSTRAVLYDLEKGEIVLDFKGWVSAI